MDAPKAKGKKGAPPAAPPQPAQPAATPPLTPSPARPETRSHITTDPPPPPPQDPPAASPSLSTLAAAAAAADQPASPQLPHPPSPQSTSAGTPAAIPCADAQTTGSFHVVTDDDREEAEAATRRPQGACNVPFLSPDSFMQQLAQRRTPRIEPPTVELPHGTAWLRIPTGATFRLDGVPLDTERTKVYNDYYSLSFVGVCGIEDNSSKQKGTDQGCVPL